MAGKRTSVIQVMIAGDSSDLQKATRGGVSGFKVLGVAAVTAAKVIASAATAIAGFSIREFAKFDDAMVKSTAIMGDLSDSMKKDMSDAARQVALTTTFAADEAAEAFFFLRSAGLSAAQSIAALPQVSRFAQAGAFDLALATDLLTDAQSALGMTSQDTAEHLEELTRLSDVLVGANTLANASVEQFSAALTNKAGAALRIMNKEVEEGVAALALLADRGVKGTEAGEKLSIMLRDVTRAAARSPDKFRALGLEILDADGNLRNIADVTEEFTRVLGGMSDAQAANTLESLGLTRSVGDVIRTMFGGADQIRAYEDALKSMGGMTDEVAEKQLKSFSAQLSLLRSGLSDVAITIGEALAGPLGRFVAWFREQTPAIKAFVEGAIPQVAAFVDRATAKFLEFKTFYDDNIKEPLGNLLERLRELGGLTLDKIFEFKDTATTFLKDFANAVAEEDSEEAGRILGETITNLLNLAIDAGGDLTDAIGEWFGRQDWAAIGASVAVHTGQFAKGLFSGLFMSIDEESGEFEFDWSKTMRLLAAGLVLRIPVFRNALKSKSGLFGLPIVGTILSGLGNAILFLTPGLGRIGGWIGRTLAGRIGAAVAGTRVAGIFSNIGLTIQRLFAGQFSSLPARLWASITGMFSGLGGFLLRGATGLSGSITTGINTAMLAVKVWLASDGLGILLRGFARVVGGIVVAIFGWPAALAIAATVAFMEFIRRFRIWNEGKGDDYESFGERIVEFIADGWENLKDWFNNTITQWFRDRLDDFISFTDGLKGDYENIGSRIVDGMIQGVKDTAGKLLEEVTATANSAVSAVKSVFGIKSPSLVFAGIGDDLMAGMSLGIDRSSMGAVGAMVDASRQLTGVDFSAPQVPVGSARGGMGGDTFNITVTSADPQAVVEALRRYTRANGPLGSVVSV